MGSRVERDQAAKLPCFWAVETAPVRTVCCPRHGIALVASHSQRVVLLDLQLLRAIPARKVTRQRVSNSSTRLKQWVGCGSCRPIAVGFNPPLSQLANHPASRCHRYIACTPPARCSPALVPTPLPPLASRSPASSLFLVAFLRAPPPPPPPDAAFVPAGDLRRAAPPHNLERGVVHGPAALGVGVHVPPALLQPRRQGFKRHMGGQAPQL